MGKKRFSRKQTREIAIEFAKYLMEQKVCRTTHGQIGSDLDIEQYSPKEFKLMRGELEMNSNEIFESFIDYYAQL